MSKHTSYGAAATSEQTRELTADELDQVAGGDPEHSNYPRRLVMPLKALKLVFHV